MGRASLPGAGAWKWMAKGPWERNDFGLRNFYTEPSPSSAADGLRFGGELGGGPRERERRRLVCSWPGWWSGPC